jgi:hypothetical protein
MERVSAVLPRRPVLAVSFSGGFENSFAEGALDCGCEAASFESETTMR